MALLNSLSQTIAHLDAYRSNLFKHGNEFALVDWAFVGRAALGEELTALVGATLLLGHVPVADAEALETAVWEGYQRGLLASGDWRLRDWEIGDWETMRLAYRRAMALRYGIMTIGSMMRTEIEPGFAEHWERQEGRPLSAILAQRAALVRYLSYVGRTTA